MRARQVCGVAIGLLVFASVFLYAQDTASLTGTVRDASGASVANAQVVVTNAERGISRTTATNSDGGYDVAALPAPGSYDITVTAQGFKKYEAKGVVLNVAQKARNDVALQVGGSTIEVTVEGTNVAQVDTESSEMSGTVTGKEISQLQLNGRNFSQLATLTAGVSNQSGQDEASVGISGNVAFSVNGGRTEYNNWELDGGDNMDNGSNTSLNVYPSVDAIAEFKVLTSSYGAQYGRNGSGTVEVETKSGTSKFHGDLYEFVRNDAFRARNYFDQPGTIPGYKKNDFGYTIGGPVFIPGLYNNDKQKTFFFWSQEWRRDRVAQPASSVVVPSAAERGCPSATSIADCTPGSFGDFSDVCGANPSSCPVQPAFINGVANPNAGLPFPGNMVPIDQTNAAPLLAMIPLPTVAGTGPQSWNASPTLPTNWREELFKIDHNINSKNRVSFRYIHDSWEQIEPSPLWTNGTSFPTIQTDFIGPGVSLVARLTSTFSPTLLNEFVASYTTDHLTMINVGAWQRSSGQTFGIYQNGFGGGRMPGISLGGDQFNFSEDVGYLPNGPYNSNPTYTYRDNITKIFGKHNLVFGGYLVFAQKNELAQPGVGPGGFLTYDATNQSVSTGNSFADLLLGQIASFQQTSAQPKFYNRYKIFEPYVQDDWRVTSRLTLNLGLRVSLFGTYRERYHDEFNFDPSHYVLGDSSVDPNTGLVIGNAFNGIVQCGVTAGVPDSCMKGHLFNPAPRIGFAWDPWGNGKTAIRGGYGVFFEHTNGNEANAESLEPSASPTVQTTTASNISGYDNIVPPTGGGTAPLAVISIPNKAVWPYVQQWHLDIQREFFGHTVATISYVGTKGTHLTRSRDTNALQAVPLSENPFGPGQPLTSDICNSLTANPGSPIPNSATVYGQTVTDQNVVNHINVACNGNADLFRTSFPGISGINRLEEAGSSSYNGLEISVRRTVGHLQLNGSYTYSHAIDDSSSARDSRYIDSYNLPIARASSNFDQRHLFNLGYVYDLPTLSHQALANWFLGGWQWSGITTFQTGSPFSVANALFGDNAGVGNTLTSASAQSYPDLIGNPNSGIQQFPFPGFGPLLFNQDAFTAPRGLTFGNTPRNFLRNPTRTNFDMALYKHFIVTETKAFEFRAEAFNVFNHTQWFYLGGDTGSAASNAGQGSNATLSCYDSQDPSCSQNNPFFRAAGAHNPRILQLGLKFIF